MGCFQSKSTPVQPLPPKQQVKEEPKKDEKPADYNNGGADKNKEGGAETQKSGSEQIVKRQVTSQYSKVHPFIKSFPFIFSISSRFTT